MALTRRHLLVSTTAGGAALLAACGTATTPAATTTLQPATLIWTSWAVNGSALERVQEQQKAFATAMPQIKIDIQNQPSGDEYYTKLKAQLASGSGPDVVRAASPDWENLARGGALLDLAPRIAKEPKNAPLQNIYPNIAPSTKYKGKTMGIPFASTYLVLYVNKTLWQRNGVALPPTQWAQSAWTWDAMLQKLKAVTKRPDSIGTPLPSIGNRLTAMLLSNNASAFNETLTETTITKPEYYEGLQWIADLRNVHQVATTSAEDKDKNYAYAAGKLGMSMSITVGSLSDTLQSINKAFDMDLYPIPTGPKATKPGTLNSLSLWVVNKDSKALDAAWTFAKWLGGPEGMDPELRRGFTAPTYPGLEQRFMVEFPELNRQVVLDAQKFAAPLLNPPGYDQIESRLRDAITEVYEGKKNARQAMTELQGPINAMIKAASV